MQRIIALEKRKKLIRNVKISKWISVKIKCFAIKIIVWKELDKKYLFSSDVRTYKSIKKIPK